MTIVDLPIPAASRIEDTCDEIKELLLAKNKAYGNSALNPVRIFSKTNAKEGLACRIDDKLSRLAKGQMVPNEDTVLDLCGYLILYLINARQDG